MCMGQTGFKRLYSQDTAELRGETFQVLPESSNLVELKPTLIFKDLIDLKSLRSQTVKLRFKLCLQSSP